MMKKFTLFFAAAATMLFGSVTSASAQQTEEDIDWINHAVDVKTAINSYGEGKPGINGIYLCNWNPTKGTYTFVTAGGEYGTQAIVTNRGMRMYVEQANDDGYRFKGTLLNTSSGLGSLLGLEPNDGIYTGRVFLDRGNDASVWVLTAESHNLGEGKSKTYYTITIKNGDNNANTLSVDSENNTLQMVASSSNNTNVNRWLLIPRDAFREAILGVTHQTNLEVSGLFLNTRFVRYMDKNASWKWYSRDDYNTEIPEDGSLGVTGYKAYRSMKPGAECIKADGQGHNSSYDRTLDYAKEYGNFCVAQMKEPIIMRQSYDKVPAGTYTITAQAFVSNDDNDITNERNIAYLFASNGQAGGTPDGALIPILDETDQTNFTDNYYKKHQRMAYTIKREDYFRANVAAADFLGTGGKPANHDASIYNPDMTYKLIQISINVPDTNGDGTGTLMIGVAKNERVGTLYVDNIRVYYSGTSEFGINAYGTSNVALSNDNPTGIDEFQYGYARAFNLARDFGADADGDGDIDNPQWEALVLPVNLTTTQVKTAFGDEVKLSKLEGLANNGNQIRFIPEYLDGDPNKVVLKAGECYVIKVTNAPDVARDDPYTFDVTSNELGQNRKIEVTYTGPIYQINGVTREYTLTDLLKNNGTDYSLGKVTKSYETNDGTLDYEGFFCWSKNVTKAGDYVVSRGKMYHLTSRWENLTGTMWLLRDRTNRNALSFDFGDGQTTDINNIVTETAPESATANGVYNLNGQKVAEGTSLNGLAKGIYIVNGRKHVVR